MLRWATLVVAAAAAGSTARTEAEVAPLEYEDTWVLRNVAAMPDGYPRQIIAVTPIAELRPIHTDPVHPWNDTMAVFPEIISIPGPAVRIQQGGRVRITVENRLHSPVSIHWHGIHMDHQAWMDGTSGFTECGIPQHGRFTYDFVVDQEPGTHWWHAHNKAEFVDGAWGAIIVEPREGVPDLINQRWGVEPDYDQLLFVGDWSHESWEDNEQKYLGRQGEYPGYDADRQRMSEPSIPHLPDYPWPTHSVILNGRGQFPCEGRYVSADDCRIIMEWGWVWWENQSLPRPEPNPARPNLCRGQCNPVRPPYVGQCGVTPPAVLKCEAGGHVRLRLINSGAGLPMRVWIDRHELTIVARDGLPVEDSGPHVAVLLHSGVRFDVIVHCNQAAEVGSVFKIFSAFAIEFYPGITQRFSAVGWFPLAGYARLEYSDAPADAPIVTPEHPPESWHPHRNGTQDVSLYASYGPEFNRCYDRPGLAPGDYGCTYLPTYLEMQLRPRGDSPSRGETPAAVERIEVHTKVYGNWWNHLVNTTHHNGPLPTRGLRLEWWEVDGHAPLYAPSEPLLLTQGVLGLPTSDERSFGHVDPRLVPYIAQIEYDAVNPKWYEFVIFNYEGQNHPYHLHGFHGSIIGYNYSEVRLTELPNFDPERQQLVYDPEYYDIPDLGEAAPTLAVADTFTVPFFGFVVLRIRSDNPGVWLFHCHMDYHLAAGMGFIVDAQKSEGGYGLGPPPDDMPMCGETGSWGGRGSRRQATKTPGDDAQHGTSVTTAAGAGGGAAPMTRQGLGQSSAVNVAGWGALACAAGLFLSGAVVGGAVAARQGRRRLRTEATDFKPMLIE